MIFVGIGSNLPSRAGSPLETCEAALSALARRGVGVLRRSRWYESAPVPASDQPWFVNGVAEIESRVGPEALLQILHDIESEFGRRRRALNEARPLDLDLLAYDEAVVGNGGVIIPHPRLQERSFVLLPLAELAPAWRHPVSGERIDALIARLPPEQTARPLAAGP